MKSTNITCSMAAVLLVAGMLTAGVATASEDAAADVETKEDFLARVVPTCGGCHGADGNSTATMFPKLAGQYQSYLAQSLKAYRSGARDNALMSSTAAALTDKQIKYLAAYFSSQESTLQTVTPK